jgi:hypothetical protein
MYLTMSVHARQELDLKIGMAFSRHLLRPIYTLLGHGSAMFR